MRGLACIVTLAFASCSAPQESASPDVEQDVEQAEYGAEAEAVNPCGSPETYQTIKGIVFDEVVKGINGDPVPINDLRRSVAATMKFPRVTGSQPDLERTDCAGRLVLGIPPAARRAFDNEPELEADVDYSVQPAADGSGDIVMVEGIQFIVGRLISAENFRSANRLASRGGPQLERTFNPSFDCGQRLTNVERMICQDENLAFKDRRLSDAFKDRLGALSGYDRTIFLNFQRNALADRAKCPNTSCVNDWFDYQLSTYN